MGTPSKEGVLAFPAVGSQRSAISCRPPANFRSVTTPTTPPASPPRRSILTTIYDVILGAAAGFSIGWFAWIFSDRLGDDGTPQFWPFALAGVIGGIALVRWARSRKGARRWINVLWIPVLLFVLLMAAIVMALRNMN